MVFSLIIFLDLILFQSDDQLLAVTGQNLRNLFPLKSAIVLISLLIIFTVLDTFFLLEREKLNFSMKSFIVIFQCTQMKFQGSSNLHGITFINIQRLVFINTIYSLKENYQYTVKKRTYNRRQFKNENFFVISKKKIVI